MDINRDNYEAWLLDLIEGRLTAEQVQQVRDFLLLNPHCTVNLDEIEPWVLEKETISFAGKSGLRRVLPDQDSMLSESGFDLFSIARMEGDLSDRQVEDHQRLLESDDEKLKEWQAWKRTRLVGEAVPFKGKRDLKRRSAPRSRVIWISVASVAAAITLFFAIFTADQGLTGPEEALPVEAEVELPESNGVVPVTTEESVTEQSPAIMASEPAILIIRKHHDPPELTGEKKDTVPVGIQEEKLRPGPLKVAMLETVFMNQTEEGIYDRIEPLDLPPLPVYTEKGIRPFYREFLDERDISLLTIANAGIEGINFLAGSDFSLDLSRDGKGDVSGFRFRSERLSVDTPVKKQE